MTRSRIDFAPHTLRVMVVRTPILTWIIGGIGLLFCTKVGLTAWNLAQLYQVDKARLVAVQTKLTERDARKPTSPKSVIPAPQAAAVNQAIAQLNLPWRDVLDAVESATPPTIALVALEPDAKRRLVKGIAEAKNADAMVSYVEQLKREAFFDAVTLTKHETNEQDPNKPLRFQIEARWAEGAR